MSAPREGQAERMAALGAMAAGLAHELRNPLNAASLQLSVARRRLRHDADARARAALDLAAAEMTRLAVLVDEFLQFARPQPLQLERLDLRALAATTLDELAGEALAVDVELVLVPGPEVIVQADGDRLSRVIFALVENAIEASSPGGRVLVRLRSAPEITLEVEDHGDGPPAAPIFDPFFTTKAAGTGLGLAVAHRAVTDHDGAIDVVRRSQRTVFTVTLPG